MINTVTLALNDLPQGFYPIVMQPKVVEWVDVAWRSLTVSPHPEVIIAIFERVLQRVKGYQIE